MPIFKVSVYGHFHGHHYVEAPSEGKAFMLANRLPLPADERIDRYSEVHPDDVEAVKETDGRCACRCGCAAKIAFEVARREPQLKFVTGALHLCDACLNNSRQKKQECALAAWMPEDEEV